MKDRPYVKCYLTRELRRVASYKNRNNQFTPEQFDQFMAKCRTNAAAEAICDFTAESEDFEVKNIPHWMNQKFGRLRRIIEELPEANLEAPEMYYNAAPETLGRRARRAMGPRYQTDEAFQADKRQFEAEMRGDVGPLNEEPNEESAS